MNDVLAGLDGFAVRDQWPEITRAATRPVGQAPRAVHLVDRPRPTRRSRQPLLVAAVVMLVVTSGIGVLVTRSERGDRPVGPATNARPSGGWTVGRAVPTPFPDDRTTVAPGGPLLAGDGQVVVAGFRGSVDAVVVEASGGAHVVRLPSAAMAATVGRDSAGTLAEVVLLQDGTLVRIDGGAVRPLASGLAVSARNAPSIAVAHGLALVARADGVVSVDLTTGATAVVPGVRATLLAASATTVWALDQATGTLTRVDAATLRITGRVEARDGFSIAAAGSDVFLARRPANQLSRIGSDLVEHTLAAIDPTATGLAAAGPIVWVTADVVATGYRAVDGGLAGAVARPTRFGLAAAFDGRSTWLLGLGDGLRRLEQRS